MNPATTTGQEDYNAKLYTSYVAGNMAAWEDPMTQMEKQAAVAKDADLLHALLLAEYGYIGYCINNDQEEKAEKYIEKAEDHIDQLLQFNKNWAAVYAVKAALYGFRISLSPAMAVFYGPRNQRNIDKALESDPSEPMAWFESGNSEFFRPAAFGGSKSKGIEYYRKAIDLFEKTGGSIKGQWLYLNMLVMLAYAYEKTGQQSLAQDVYRKALQYEPGFLFAGNKIR
jgi:tetratricopeptide (TPR) repeat protein